MRRLLAFGLFLFALLAVTRPGRAQDHHADPGHHEGPAHPPASAAHPPASAAPAPAAPAKAAAPAADGDATPEPAAPPGPTTLHLGVDLEKVTKFDLGQGIFEAEFFVSVRCDAEPCKPNLDLVNGTFKGKPETVFEEKEKHLKILKYKAELTTLVDLGEYPFDDHQLPILITDKTPNVTFVAENAKPDAQNVKVPGWDVLGAEAEVGKLDAMGHAVSIYGYNLSIKRPGFQGFMKNMAPPLTMFLVLMFSLFMKPKMAAPRLAAGTGSFMGVVTFHVTTSNGIPPLGFFTRIDKFMFTMYVIWLVHIAMNIAILRAEEGKKEKQSELLYLTAWGLIPGLALILWTLVFTKLV